MLMFGSISGKEVDEFAKSLVEEVLHEFPPQKTGQKGRKHSAKKVAGTVGRIIGRAVAFKREHRLGIYKTARLGNTFKWELKERGYDSQFIDAIMQDLVVRLSVK
jgi:hypothetical protein